ncbi:MAG: hypothetical protein AB7G21_09695 [Dehalococcoidia bacterium]
MVTGQARIIREHEGHSPGDDHHPLGRIIVHRADGTVWEARADDVAAVQWADTDARRLIGLHRQDLARLDRLRAENKHPPIDPTPFEPTWLALQLEVGAGIARLVLAEPTATDARELARTVVERADCSMWEAFAADPRTMPALRLTQWEAEAFRRVDRHYADRARRLEHEVAGALDRARIAAPLVAVGDAR